MIQLLTLNKNWGFFFICSSLILSVEIWKRTHWSLALSATVFMISGIYTGMGAFPVMAFALFAGALLCLDKYATNILEPILALFFAFSVIVTLGYTTMGASGNPSMNGCMIAVLLPFAALLFQGVPEYVWIALAATAIFKTDASIPVGVLFVVVSSGYWAKNGWLFGLRQLVVMTPLFVVGYYLNPAQFFTTTGRWHIWTETLSWWWSSGKLWFGLGTGALDTILRHKLSTDPHYKTVIWAHNDYLQVLFDNGIVGLCFLLIALVKTLEKSFSRPWLFSACMGYAATALFNFPMHVPLHAMVGLLLVWMVWCTEDLHVRHG